MEQVISNLVSNAIKFSPSGKTVRVTVAVAVAAAAVVARGRGPTEVVPLTIAVEDQGPGMSEEGLLKIRGDMSQSQRRPEHMAQGQGSGLGLSLCKQIVSLHGGAIQVLASQEDDKRRLAGAKDEDGAGAREGEGEGEGGKGEGEGGPAAMKRRARGCRVVVTIPFNVVESADAPVAGAAAAAIPSSDDAAAFESVVRGGDSVQTKEPRAASSSSFASLLSAGRSFLYQDRHSEPHSLGPAPLPAAETAAPPPPPPPPSGADALVVDGKNRNPKPPLQPSDVRRTCSDLP